jgi:hypothetical protein
MANEHATQRRVKFDFEVDFSNGGGLQGQDFRLDIEGEDISEEELARYIVEDMRLLMVEEVRILNKEIIAERHKRVDPSWAAPRRIVLEGVLCTILYPKFREFSEDELRRISLPRTRVNRRRGSPALG